MNNEARSSELARRILISVFKIVLPDTADRIASIADIVDALAAARTSFWDRKDLGRRLEAVADRLARRLSNFEETEFRNLPENEKIASTQAVCDAIASIELTKNDIINYDSNPETVFAHLLPGVRAQLRAAFVSESGMEYGRVFLKEASRFLVNLVRDLPDFTQDVVIENLAITKRVHALLERSIDGVVLPSLRLGTQLELSTFEAEYRSEVIHRNKDLELFGIHIPVPELRRQPLDIAYISLTASGKTIYETKVSRDRSNSSNPDQYRKAKVQQALGLIARRSKSTYRNRQAAARTGSRILITGQAGSGKTTLAQWLVVRAAESNFPEELHSWNSCIPLIAKFRNLFRGDETVGPSDEELFSAGYFRSVYTPGDWLTSALNSREMLLVLDGLDELADFHRSSARIWLENFMRKHKSVNIVITSRPDAIDVRWFEQNDYDRLDLQPMTLEDIRSCVNSWFEAVSSIVPEQEDDLAVQRKSLLSDVERRASIQELAETPLVCAMLCAFYAYSLSITAPESRGELYQQVIESLVDTRDRARKAIDSDRRRFTLKEKLTLLQALARYMTEQQVAEIQIWSTSKNISTKKPRENALSIVEKEIRRLPAISLSARQTLEYLLQRSVVFREVAPNIGQFAHRSLQEFLTGRSFANTGSILSLLAYVGIDSWREIIAFAAGNLDQRSATQFINGILDKSTAPKVARRDILLLAAECLSSAVVDSSLTDRAALELRSVLPPRTLQEAELVGRSGDGVIQWLAGHQDQSDLVVASCIRAAAVTGSPAGLTLIASYRERINSRYLKEELINAWRYFDPSEYAREVLTRISLDDCPITLTSSAMLEAASGLTSLRQVKIDSRGGTLDFRRWRALQHLVELDCSKFYRLESLRGISVLANLRRLALNGRARVTDFSEIRNLTKMIELYMDDCSGLADPTPISSLSSLWVLSLNGCTSLNEFDWLSKLRQLRTLSLNRCGFRSLAFCAGLSQLRTLRAQAVNGVTATASLESCTNLSRLELRLASGRSHPVALPVQGQLRSLVLSGEITMGDIGSVCECNALSELTITGVHEMRRLTEFSGLRALTKLRLLDCRNLVSIEDIGHLDRLSVLDLSGSDIRHLDVQGGFSGLQEIYLEGCAGISSGVYELASLPSLRILSLPAMDESVLNELERIACEAGNDALEVRCSDIQYGYEAGL